MRFYRSHPVLAILILLAVIGLGTPLAYAVVQRVFLTVDPAKSPHEIEQDVHQQLEQAGIAATVHAEKRADDRVQIEIHSADDRLGSDLAVAVRGQPDATSIAHGISIEDNGVLDHAQIASAQQAVTSSAVIDALVAGNQSGAEDAIRAALAERGFHDVTVGTDDSGIVVTIKSPPTP